MLLLTVRRIGAHGGVHMARRRLSPVTASCFTMQDVEVHRRPAVVPMIFSHPAPTFAQEQRRSMMALSLRQRYGKKHGYTYDECRLQVCYSPYDLDIDEEDIYEEQQDMTFLRVPFRYANIREVLEEIFIDIQNLEYYDNKEWHPLNERTMLDAALQTYRAGKRTLRVRSPMHYEGDDQWDEMDRAGADLNVMSEEELEKRVRNLDNLPNIQYPQDGRPKTNVSLDLSALHIERTIKNLVSQLKNEKYTRHEGVVYGENNETKLIYSLLNTKTQKKILTQTWLMEQAERDPALRRLFLAVPHALKHIQECMHYDILWEPVPKLRRYHNGDFVRNHRAFRIKEKYGGGYGGN